MLQGQDYELGKLSPLLVYLDRASRQGCSLSTGPAAVIRLEAAALAMQAGRPEANDLLQRGRDATRQALACTPHDSYLWYAYFWVEEARALPVQEVLPYLSMSYELGPHEAWISQSRSFDAWPLLPEMPHDLQQKVRREFLNLVRDSPRAAASILRDADAPSRAAILATLEELPLKKREEFARVLDRRNITIDIPGVDYRKWYQK